MNRKLHCCCGCCGGQQLWVKLRFRQVPSRGDEQLNWPPWKSSSLEGLRQRGSSPPASFSSSIRRNLTRLRNAEIQLILSLRWGERRRKDEEFSSLPGCSALLSSRFNKKPKDPPAHSESCSECVKLLEVPPENYTIHLQRF